MRSEPTAVCVRTAGHRSDRTVRRRAAWCSTLALFAIGSSACAHNVQLKFPESEPGDSYVCSATELSEAKCRRAEVIDPAAHNESGTAFIILPPQCAGHFNQITIHDAGSSEPSAHVICAPLENIPE